MTTLSDLTHDLAADRIAAFARDNRLTTDCWHGEWAGGEEIACLLGAIHADINNLTSSPA